MYITHKCGHSESHRIAGNRSYKEWRAAKLADELCSECWKQEQARQNAEAAKENAANELPALTGTEKQILWAEGIRKSILDWIQKGIEGDRDARATMSGIDLEDPIMPAVLDALMAKTEARFWIDNRDRRIGYILEEITEKLDRSATVAAAKPDADVLGEATVRPTAEKTATPADIQFSDTMLRVVFPEKREDFRLLLRAMGFQWSGSAWAREIGALSGPMADRVAETGNRLLNAGFIVRIQDAALRARAIAGDYAPECKKWVMRHTKNGTLAIRWPREGENYYNAARRLPGAQWVSPQIVVPVTAYDAVWDFAEANGFSITPKAQADMEAAKAAHDRALIAAPAAPPDMEPAPGAMPPATGEIDPELADD